MYARGTKVICESQIVGNAKRLGVVMQVDPLRRQYEVFLTKENQYLWFEEDEVERQ